VVPSGDHDGPQNWRSPGVTSRGRVDPSAATDVDVLGPVVDPADVVEPGEEVVMRRGGRRFGSVIS
jgi:hypothetical protein